MQTRRYTRPTCDTAWVSSQILQIDASTNNFVSWANRTDEWVRILCVVLDAKPTSTEIQGSNERHLLPEVWDV